MNTKLALFSALFAVAAQSTLGQSQVLISSDAAGVPASDDCWSPDASFDGRWVAFSSSAPNLSPNGFEQVFLKDLATWSLEYVSLSSTGALANAKCASPRVSWDGRYVAFHSRASNLASGGIPNLANVFVRDRWAGITTRESLGSGGVLLNETAITTDISFDGRFVLFLTDATNAVPGITTGWGQHYLRDRWTGQVLPTAVSTAGAPANDASWLGGGGVSGDGRYVVFSSTATNLVPGDTNGVEDVFLRDTVAGTLTRLSVDDLGQQGNGTSTDAFLSDDGRFATFGSQATNLVTPDVNGVLGDVFVYELASGQLERVTVSTGGQQADSHSVSRGLSWDGRYVIFESIALNLVVENFWDYDTFVHDRITGSTEIVSSPAVGFSSPPARSALSPGGRFALINTFEEWDPGHPTGTWQIYAVDRGLVCIGPFVYCTGKTNSLGCDPFVATYGCSSATQTSEFTVFGGNVRNNKQGLLFYGVSGQAATPFQGATMCVAPPKKRTPVRNSFGNAAPANDCSGLWAIDMNEFAAGLGGGNPLPALLTPGTVVSCQWWGRDPGAPFNTALTDAVEYLVGL